MKIYNMVFTEVPVFLELKEEAKKADKNAIVTTFDGANKTYITHSKKAAEAIVLAFDCSLSVVETASGLKGGVM